MVPPLLTGIINESQSETMGFTSTSSSDERQALAQESDRSRFTLFAEVSDFVEDLTILSGDQITFSGVDIVEVLSGLA